MMFMGSISMLVVMAVTGEWWAFTGRFGAGHWATVAAMVNNALAFYLIFELIKRAGPVFFSMVIYVATWLAWVLEFGCSRMRVAPRGT